MAIGGTAGVGTYSKRWLRLSAMEFAGWISLTGSAHYKGSITEI